TAARPTPPRAWPVSGWSAAHERAVTLQAHREQPHPLHDHSQRDVSVRTKPAMGAVAFVVGPGRTGCVDAFSPSSSAFVAVWVCQFRFHPGGDHGGGPAVAPLRALRPRG